MSTTNDPARTSPAAAPASAAALDKSIRPQDAFARQLLRLDRVLLVLVLLLAFFLGSFVASNSDLVMHLAVANPFGEEASRWPHHAWLPSLLLRIVYEPFSPSAEVGGGIAVALKALVVVAIAVVLLLIRRRGQGLVLPLVCTALALLVMSPRLFLEPFVLSLLLLAVTLWLLVKSTEGSRRFLWYLPPLFLLWVNVDQWFVLGPITLALFLLGEWLQGFLGIPGPADSVTQPEPATPPSPSPAVTSLPEKAPGSKHKVRRVPPPSAAKQSHAVEVATKKVPTQRVVMPERFKEVGKVLLAGLLACLVNPWLFRAWTLPTELAYLNVATVNALPAGMTAAGTTVYRAHRGDSQFFALVSPFSSEYWTRPSVGLNVAGLAYFLLLAVGVASFYLVTMRPKTASPGPRPGLSLPLFVLFVFFAILSFTTQRLIPLFAVVAGPITALNLQDFARRRLPAPAAMTSRQHNQLFLGRGLALAGCLLLAILAWPGWLHGNADDWHHSHRVRWHVMADPDILKAADTIALVQEQTGQMKLGFCFDPEGGNYFLWPAVQEQKNIRLLCDQRYSLYADKAAEYGKLRNALRDEIEVRFGARPTDIQQERQYRKKLSDAQQTYVRLLQSLGIDFVVLTDCHTHLDHKHIAEDLLQTPEWWTLLYDDGRTIVFAWHGGDPKKVETFEPMKLDLSRLVAPKGRPANLPQLTFDPHQVPPPPMAPPGAWKQFLRGNPEPSLYAVTSDQYHLLFQVESGHHHRRYFTAWFGALGGGGVLAAHLSGQEVNEEGKTVTRKNPLQAPDLGPPAAPLLGVRAARKAVQESPNHISSYFQLFIANEILKSQEDYWAKTPVPGALRGQLRQVIQATALHNAETTQPSNTQVQQALYKMYSDMQYLDVTAEHFAKLRQSIDELKLPKDQVEGMDNYLKQLNEAVKKKRDDFKRDMTSQMDAVEKFELSLFGRISKPGETPGFQPGVPPGGLARQGLKFLQEAKADKLTPEQQKKLEFWRVTLLLVLGQAGEAQERLKAAPRDRFEPGRYEQLQAMTAVALGDYLTADKYLAEGLKRLEVPPAAQLSELHRKLVVEPAALLVELPGSAPVPAWPLVRIRASLHTQETTGTQLSKVASPAFFAAELHLLRGLLALEVGDTTAAANHLRAVLTTVPAALYFPDRAIAKRYVELLEQ
jgi:hypothetical protein